MVKNKRKFYDIAIFDSDNISEDLPYYQKCVSLGSSKSIILNIYKNSKLCFTIYDTKPIKSYLIDLECHPINKLKW